MHKYHFQLQCQNLLGQWDKGADWNLYHQGVQLRTACQQHAAMVCWIYKFTANSKFKSAVITKLQIIFYKLINPQWN